MKRVLVACLALYVQVWAFGETVAYGTLGVGLEMVTETESQEGIVLSPWGMVEASVSGYPSPSLSWYADAAARISSPIDFSAPEAFAVTEIGGSVRWGLSTLRFDLANGIEASPGQPVVLDLAPTVSFSGGNPDMSGFIEGTGGVSGAVGSGIDYSYVAALAGYSITVGRWFAPTVKISWTRSRVIDSDPVDRIGLYLDVPWYPPIAATCGLQLGSIYRSGGTPVSSPTGVLYNPEEYTEMSTRFSVGWPMGFFLVLDVDLSASVRWYDFGALEGGEPGSDSQVLTTLVPATGVQCNLSSRWSLEVETGGEWRLSNSPDLQGGTCYLSAAARYSW